MRRWLIVASFSLGCSSNNTTTATPNDGGSPPGSFAVTSSAFTSGGKIPTALGCDASGDPKKPSVPLTWTGAPAATKSFVVLMDDLHPEAVGWVHWIVTDIPSGTTSLQQGASGTAALPEGSKEFASTFGHVGYGGPCPPPKATHEYRIRVFARATATTALDVTGKTGDGIAAVLADSLAVAELRASYEPPY